MTLHDLKLRVQALISPRRVERELDEELAFHLERETQRHIANGLSPADARIRARARLGSVALAADQCRDVRGTGFVDDLARDILYAFRTFRRAPLAALTIVATVALGLGLVTVVFGVYNTVILRVDDVRSPAELFAVDRSTARVFADGLLPFTPSEHDAMRREASVFTDTFGMLALATRLEGRGVRAVLVSGNFFQALGVQPALGRTLTPDDDERLAGRAVIVLSHRGWTKLFAGDPAVVGRHVRLNGRPYEIVGVMREGFRGLEVFAPDYWAPLALAGQFRDVYAEREHEPAIEVVGRLKPQMTPEAATAGLTVWASARTDRTSIPGRPIRIRLTPRQGTLFGDAAEAFEALLLISPLFFTFGLVLMIGCANVANLLLARGVSRQREIGIRLSLGASRARIVRQLLTESLLLALAAAAGGFAVSRLFLDGALYAASVTMPAELAELLDLQNLAAPADWRVVVFLVTGAAVSTVFFGLVPALQATRFELVRTMRGEVTRDAHPGRARHALIAGQVGASALLLISAVIFLRGALTAATADPGVRTSDTVMLGIANEPRRAALLQAVMAHPSVTMVAASTRPARAIAETSPFAEAAAGNSVSAPVDQLAVSPEYFEVLGIDVVRGRSFTPAERTMDAGVVVVSETIAGRLWPNRDAVGQVMRLYDPSSGSPGALALSRTVTVVGVVRRVESALRSSYLFTFQGVYLPTGPESRGTSLILRVRGDSEQARQALVDRLTNVDPGLGGVIRVKAIAELQIYSLRIAFWVTVVLGGLALLLTVSGLFSVLSYIVEQRAQEIGVRMALGATTNNVVRLVLSQSFRPVGIGLVAGGGLAAAVAIVLMATPAASQIGSIVNVLDPVAYAASLLIIVTSCVLAVSVPALRAARIDPIATLRKD